MNTDYNTCVNTQSVAGGSLNDIRPEHRTFLGAVPSYSQ